MLDVVSLCVNPYMTQPLLAFQALQQVVPSNMIKSFRYPSPAIHPEKLPVVKFLTDVGQSIIDLDLAPCKFPCHLPALPHPQPHSSMHGIPH